MKKKLSVEDFYHQFHGVEHHNDAGDNVNPHWFDIHPSLRGKHKGLDLKAHAKSRAQKRKVAVVMKRKGTK